MSIGPRDTSNDLILSDNPDYVLNNEEKIDKIDIETAVGLMLTENTSKSGKTAFTGSLVESPVGAGKSYYREYITNLKGGYHPYPRTVVELSNQFFSGELDISLIQLINTVKLLYPELNQKDLFDEILKQINKQVEVMEKDNAKVVSASRDTLKTLSSKLSLEDISKIQSFIGSMEDTSHLYSQNYITKIKNLPVTEAAYLYIETTNWKSFYIDRGIYEEILNVAFGNRWTAVFHGTMTSGSLKSATNVTTDQNKDNVVTVNKNNMMKGLGGNTVNKTSLFSDLKPTGNTNQVTTKVEIKEPETSKEEGSWDFSIENLAKHPVDSIRCTCTLFTPDGIISEEVIVDAKRNSSIMSKPTTLYQGTTTYALRAACNKYFTNIKSIQWNSNGWDNNLANRLLKSVSDKPYSNSDSTKKYYLKAPELDSIKMYPKTISVGDYQGFIDLMNSIHSNAVGIKGNKIKEIEETKPKKAKESKEKQEKIESTLKTMNSQKK